MKYNLSVAAEAERAFTYLTELAGKDALVEVNKISPKRSLNQNSYRHLLISAFAQHYGYTNEESKLIYKELNKGIYEYDKKGRKFYRSSADLTKEEMMKSIDLFREKSAEQGYPLPLATDQDWLRELGNSIEMQSKYL